MPSAYPKWNLREFKQDPCAKIGHFHLLQPWHFSWFPPDIFACPYSLLNSTLIQYATHP
jgi:hypothetical protein